MSVTATVIALLLCSAMRSVAGAGDAFVKAIAWLGEGPDIVTRGGQNRRLAS